MSPASKSKSTKEKKAVKEQKTPTKTSMTVNGSNGLSASAYNPTLGTFLTIEASSTSSTLLHVNGRFRNIDDSDDRSGSTQGSGADYDSASNNDSHSVESDDHNKDKTNAPSKKDTIPGADNDKREKIRLKNERKHQRQKEKRAQELHERCSGYLMSRKLEALAQQLVAMGFSQERATMALILNEGKVEEAVAWLFEGGEDVGEHKDHNVETGSNLKIDISEEVARIAELEAKFKCSKPEVERVVVACEGDIDKAEETLRSQKQDPPLQSKSDEIVDPPAISNGKITIAVNQSSAMMPQKPNSVSLVPQGRDERDYNYTKGAVTLGPATKPVPKVLQPVTRVQHKLEWNRPQQMSTVVEKQWPVGGGSSPSVSYSLASSVQVSSAPSKTESRFVPVGYEFKNIHPGEPVVMMQRPQSVNAKQNVITSVSSSSTPSAASGRYPSNTEFLKTNRLQPTMPNSRSHSLNNPSPNQLYHPMQYQLHQQPLMPGGSSVDNQMTNRGNASWSGMNGSPTLAAASSLGLFSGLGSTCIYGSTSPVDWNTGGSMPSCDYTSIDWSLDRSFLPSKPNGLCFGLGQYSGNYGHGSGASAMGVNLGARPPSSNGGASSVDSSGAISVEWTSAFEGKDLFSLPRQFVSSPTL